MEINKAVIDNIKQGNTIMQVTDPEGNGTGIFYGPYLKDSAGEPKYYDNYTEALRENQWEKLRRDHKAQGLNFHAQTPAQEAAQKKQAEEFKKLKERAKVLSEAVKQNQ